MLRMIGPIIVICALLALATDALASDPSSPTRIPVASPQGATTGTCYEDAPCWNWATMGNHRRGVVTLHGDYMVVTPCKFNRLWHDGELRYSVRVHGHTYPTLDRLKGDAFARSLTDCKWRWRLY